MTNESPCLVEARSVTKRYPDGRAHVAALSGASITIAQGEAVALMGPSGCGKSTLLRLLGLVSVPTAGDVLIGGEAAPTAERDRARLRNAFFGYVQQDFAIIPHVSVHENVAIPLEYASPKGGRRERSQRVQSALEAVGLGWATFSRASSLSGGEKQRVAIARALINGPKLVLADEPTAALDASTGAQVLDLMLGARARGASLIIATHDERVAQRCDRVVHMDAGKVVVHNFA
ncbi:ABC transporter ATP-binding protein [Cellulosimicrobium marinum]|nr:ABC transporter ATP-binding protein [Cellulosimicrobium marinum]